MPQEREHQFPYPTAAEVDAAPGDPATKAARNIMVRNITGIPRRAFLMGDNDAAPILQGVRDLTGACLTLLAEIARINEADPLTDERAGDLDPDGFGAVVKLGAEVQAILEHHGCEV